MNDIGVIVVFVSFFHSICLFDARVVLWAVVGFRGFPFLLTRREFCPVLVFLFLSVNLFPSVF